ncbi:MAG TPA: PEP-CTERM sorting domain-containing protein, partial [Tepidisphaeraceae bacterium]|nr:PEP-CTERM sorting domain-containing protein [Tepidisphaeraceae bacterium]
NGSLSPTTTVNDSGSLSFGSNAGTGSLARTIGALNISANVTANLVASAFPAAPAVLNAGTLSFADTSAKLDLGNNELLTNATAPDIRALIVAHQIFTSSTGGVIGYADQGGGVTEVRFTLAGDANLDGSVDVADLGRLATNYNSAMPEWTAGDFDYNGTIDVGDLGALATNYGTSLASGPSAQSIATPTASTAIEQSTVPEPASAGVLALGAAACLAGRQRRRSRR